MHTQDLSEVAARRARLGIEPARPIVRAPIPAKTYVRRPKDFLKLDAAPTSVPERVVQPRAAHERAEEAAVIPLHRIAAERWKDILREVAEKHSMTVETLLARRRAVNIIHARQEACYRLATELGLSYPAVARRVNYYDHTTVIHAIKKYAERNGLVVNRKIETEEYRVERDAAIVRGLLVGKTVEQLADQYDLSIGRVRVIAAEQRKALEAME